MLLFLRYVVFIFVLQDAVILAAADQQIMTVEIDASDLPRKLLRSSTRIPLQDSGSRQATTVDLWYPKWVPGSHGPGGPIHNVAGLRLQDENGNVLSWKRSIGEVHEIHVSVPAGTKTLNVSLRYIVDQSITGSMGNDSFGSSELGIVNPCTVLMYREGIDIDAMRVESSIRLPKSWVASSALRPTTPVSLDVSSNGAGEASVVHFTPTSLRDFVDSPIMCGRYRKTYRLTGPDDKESPVHRLHVFSEAESVLNIHAELQQKFAGMVTQATRLFGSHPFESFDILLATSDVLVRNGLEHSQSTLNVLPQRILQQPNRLKGWNRLLVPHEYIHAWCGKYRRPSGMLTSDFHTPKAMELLWVYEGLTQYLGEVIEARCGLMNEAEFLHRIAVEVRRAIHQQGRDWRTLTDTGACSHILRRNSKYWPGLRRSQDYYMEGMLFWLEADLIIRTESSGQRSLDDFCKLFFARSGGDPHPKPFSRSDIVDALQSVQMYDWDGLILRRIETVAESFDVSWLDRLGYQIEYTDNDRWIPSNTFHANVGVDALDSIGAVIGTDGTVADLLLDSPSHLSGLGPGMKIIGVDGHAWSESRMRDALTGSAELGQIGLTVVNGDSLSTHTIHYDGGMRFMKFVPKPGSPNRLQEIIGSR